MPSTTFPTTLGRGLGATLVFPDLPAHSALGIDQSIHTTSEHFKGVKHVPPGVHVVSYAAYDETGDRYGPVTAFFVHIPAVTEHADEQASGISDVEAWMMDSAFRGPVLGWRWVPEDEALVGMEEDELGRAEAMVRDMRWDRELGSYYSMMEGGGLEDWGLLSGYVDQRVAARLSPAGGRGISGTAEEDHGVMLGSTQSVAELALSEQLLKGRERQGGGGGSGERQGAGGTRGDAASCARLYVGRCRYTAIPDPLIKDAGLSAAELTAWNLDKSAALDRLLEEAYKGRTDAFLGEMQFAYLAFLLGHSLEGFLQWKRMVALLLGCDAAVREYGGFFAAALGVVCEQLAFSFRKDRDEGLAGGEVVGDHVFEDHFLKGLVMSFLRDTVDDMGLDSRIREVVGRLAELVRTELGWVASTALVDLDDDDDEDGPVVVYLDG